MSSSDHHWSTFCFYPTGHGYATYRDPTSAIPRYIASTSPTYLIHQQPPTYSPSTPFSSSSNVELHALDGRLDPVLATITTHSPDLADIHLPSTTNTPTVTANNTLIYQHGSATSTACVTFLLTDDGTANSDHQGSQGSSSGRQYSFALPVFGDCSIPLRWERALHGPSAGAGTGGSDGGTDSHTYTLFRDDTGEAIAWRHSVDRLSVAAYVGAVAIDQVVASVAALNLLLLSDPANGWRVDSASSADFTAPVAIPADIPTITAPTTSIADTVTIDALTPDPTSTPDPAGATMDLKSLIQNMSPEDRAKLLELLLAASEGAEISITTIPEESDCGSSVSEWEAGSTVSEASTLVGDDSSATTAKKEGGSIMARIRTGSKVQYTKIKCGSKASCACLARGMRTAKAGLSDRENWEAVVQVLGAVNDVVSTVNDISQAINGN